MCQSSSSSIARGDPRPTGSPSPLLQLPVEILFLISAQLRNNPVAITALALTCKTWYLLLLPQKPVLGRRERHSLLLLLERDHGSAYYFCSICSGLHPFSPSCGPLTLEHTTNNPQLKHLRPCYQNTSFFLDGHYKLGYHHARLVMNRHCYGAPCGLPLHNLHADLTNTLYSHGWNQIWRAKVIDDQLFLCATHTISNVRLHISDDKLRSTMDRNSLYCICRHVDPSYSVAPIRLRKSREEGDLFVECRDVLGSCERCLTDYYTTVERKEMKVAKLPNGGIEWYKPKFWNRWRPGMTAWTITIVAYHLLGSARSPFDWKWRAITGNTFATDERDCDLYPPGLIQAKWLESEAGLEI